MEFFQVSMEASRKGGGIFVDKDSGFSKINSQPSLHHTINESKYHMARTAVYNSHKGICVQTF